MKKQIPRSFRIKLNIFYAFFFSGFCSGTPDRLHLDPDNCYGFIQCLNGETHKKDCSDTLTYNERKAECDWLWNEQCGQGRFC